MSKLLFYSDLSEQAVDMDIGYPNTYLISYAAGHPVFFQNQRFLSYSALAHNIPYIFNYSENDLDPDFIQKNHKILSVKAGAGAWLWKPYFILKTLERVPENSLVVYSDSGLMFVNHIKPLLEIANAKQMLLIDYEKEQIYGTLGTISNRSILQKTDCDTLACRKAPHLMAGFGIYKNTPQVRNFVKQWLEYCQHYDLLVQPTQDSNFPNYPENKNNHHQHDETILGIVNHKINFGQALLPSQELFQEYIYNHHRRTGEIAQTSLLPRYFREKQHQKTPIIRWERRFYNAPIVVKIREMFFASI